jgi:hypothetical protein
VILEEKRGVLLLQSGFDTAQGELDAFHAPRHGSNHGGRRNGFTKDVHSGGILCNRAGKHLKPSRSTLCVDLRMGGEILSRCYGGRMTSNRTMDKTNQSWLEDFHRDGYAIVRGLLTSGEVAELRQAVEKLEHSPSLQKARVPSDPLVPSLRVFYGDLLSKAGLGHLVFDDRILAVARSILGNDLIYWGDSTFHIGKGYRGLHKDCVDRGNPEGLDWQSEYDVIRMGIYLQDHEHHSGGVKMRKGSHRHPDLSSGILNDVPSHSVDLVVWKLTTTHSGNALRSRLLPGVTLQNRWENRMPSFLALPEEMERHTLLFTYSRPGIHLDRYIKYCVDRGDYAEHWRHSRGDDVAENAAKEKGVRLLKPIPDYGSKFSL